MGLQLVSPSALIKTCRFAAAGATVSKTPVIVNTKVFIPMNTKGAGVANEFCYEAELTGAPKASGEAFNPGAAIYWNATNGNFTTTSAGATLCGHVIEPSLSADTTVTGKIAFNAFV